MTKEYIERGALIEDLNCCGCVTVYGKAFINAVTHRINLHQAADVVEVKHGEWEFNETGYQCSKCQCDSLCDGWNHPVRSKCCPNCGAKMDGETDGQYQLSPAAQCDGEGGCTSVEVQHRVKVYLN